MYGAGLRLMECLRLRVQDIDFAANQITVRDGKGSKDRVTMLPESVKTTLREHLRLVKIIHEQDVAGGWGRVEMPYALDRKYPGAAPEWRWQWVFPPIEALEKSQHPGGGVSPYRRIPGATSSKGCGHHSRDRQARHLPYVPALFRVPDYAGWSEDGTAKCLLMKDVSYVGPHSHPA